MDSNIYYQPDKEIISEYARECQVEIFAKILKENNPAKRKQKLAKFANGKGFESDMVWKVIETMDFDPE